MVVEICVSMSTIVSTQRAREWHLSVNSISPISGSCPMTCDVVVAKMTKNR